MEFLHKMLGYFEQFGVWRLLIYPFVESFFLLDYLRSSSLSMASCRTPAAR